MAIIIKEVTSLRDLKKFIKFPNKLYKGNNYFVPPLIAGELGTLRKDKNPAFEFCEAKYWMAYNSKNEPVGRIAGIINHNYNKKIKINYARFGWLDFIEDEEVAETLLKTVEKWGQENNMDFIDGPLGLSEFDASGILVKGFDEMPTAYGKYNYPYYSRIIENLGYKKETDWVEYNVKVPVSLPDRYCRMIKITEEKNNIHLVKFSTKKELIKYADGIFELLNKAYENIHGFSKLTPGQLEDLKKQFLPLLRLKFVALVADSNNKIIGFGICLPSLSKAIQKAKGKMFPTGFLHIFKALIKNDTLDSLLIAIDRDYKDKGVTALIFYKIGKAIIKSNITNIETTRELENNYKVQNLWDKFEVRQHKTARCYIKALSSESKQDGTK